MTEDKRENKRTVKNRQHNVYFFQKAASLLLARADYVRGCFSQAPQAVVKVAGFGRQSGVKKMMFYVARVEDKKGRPELELETDTGAKVKGREEIEAIYKDWKRSFDSRKNGRDTTHIVLSASAENTPKNRLRVLSAARETARKEIGELGYEYVIGLHQDAKSPHVHIIVKNRNVLGKKKFKLNPPDLFRIRETFAKELTKNGLEHSATYKIHRFDKRKKRCVQADISRATKEILKSTLPITERKAALDALNSYALKYDVKFKEFKKTLKIIDKLPDSEAVKPQARPKFKGLSGVEPNEPIKKETKKKLRKLFKTADLSKIKTEKAAEILLNAVSKTKITKGSKNMGLERKKPREKNIELEK